MPDKWTGQIKASLHINGISQRELANHLMMNERYISSILNGKRKPKNAEQRLKNAIGEIIKERRQ